MSNLCICSESILFICLYGLHFVVFNRLLYIYILFASSNVCIFKESTIYIYMHGLSCVALYRLLFTFFVSSNFYIFIGSTQQFLYCSSLLLLGNLLLIFSTFFTQYSFKIEFDFLILINSILIYYLK